MDRTILRESRDGVTTKGAGAAEISIKKLAREQLFLEHLLKPRSEKLEGSSIEVGFVVLGSTGGGLLPSRKFYGGSGTGG
jgi:hypothetical protein